MQMVEWLERIVNNNNSYIIYLWVLLGGGEVFDMVIGTLIAKFSSKKKFSSSKWKMGVIFKMAQFGLTLYLFAFFSIFGEYGVTLYTTMVIALILAEVYSILGHLSLVDDNKVDVFKEFLQKLTKKDTDKK